MIATAQMRIGPHWKMFEIIPRAEAKAFTEAVLNGTDTPVTGFDGLQPVKIALAADKSLKEGRPVKLSEIG